MSDVEVRRLLERCQLVRVAFQDGEAAYLVPLGCVWHDGALYGVADSGRKTEIAKRNPRVAFQADTARETGLFEWESVTGEGEFVIVSDPKEVAQAMDHLRPLADAAPDWWKREQEPKMSAGELIVWRLRPVHTSGVQYVRPEEA